MKQEQETLTDADVVKVLESCPFASSRDIPLRSVAQAIEEFEWEDNLPFMDS